MQMVQTDATEFTDLHQSL